MLAACEELETFTFGDDENFGNNVCVGHLNALDLNGNVVIELNNWKAQDADCCFTAVAENDISSPLNNACAEEIEWTFTESTCDETRYALNNENERFLTLQVTHHPENDPLCCSKSKELGNSAGDQICCALAIASQDRSNEDFSKCHAREIEWVFSTSD